VKNQGKGNDDAEHGVSPNVFAKRITIGAGRTAVYLDLRSQGSDLVIRITGGRAHVGAVSVCDSSSGRAHARAGERTLQLPGHREGPLAAEAAETLAVATGRTCAAVVGIHQDDATPDEIHHIVLNVRQGLQQLVAALAAGSENEVQP